MTLTQNLSFVNGSAASVTGRSERDVQALKERLNCRQWYHRIDLGDGVVTPGMENNAVKLTKLHLPARLDGWDVLDIWAYEGFYSFECERRGARSVLAIDKFCGTAPRGTLGDPDGFRMAKAALGSRVRCQAVPLEALSAETVGTFDLVLFLSVLYHCRDPFLQLRTVRGMCRKMCIIDTHCDALDQSQPSMRFYPGTTLNGDASNWWGPNPACVVEMCREAGFSRVEQVDRYDGVRFVFHAYV